MTLVFNTDTFEGSDHVNRWHDVVCRSYAECDGLPDKSSKFSASLEIGDLGLVQVTHVKSTPFSYIRGARDLRRDGNDDIFVAVMLEGEAKFEQNGRRVVQGQGDVLLYDAGRTYRFDYDEDYSAVLLRMKRATMQSRIPLLDKLGGTVLSGQGAYGAMSSGLLDNAMRISTENANSRAVVLSMVDLLSNCFSAESGLEEVVSRGERDKLAQIKRYLLDHLGNEDLDLKTISRDQNISMRSLSRTFSREGETPMGWLQSQRLAATYSALSEGRVRSVTEAAFSNGFHDLSHFGRAFKKCYGKTPRQILCKAK